MYKFISLISVLVFSLLAVESFASDNDWMKHLSPEARKAMEKAMKNPEKAMQDNKKLLDSYSKKITSSKKYQASKTKLANQNDAKIIKNISSWKRVKSSLVNATETSQIWNFRSNSGNIESIKMVEGYGKVTTDMKFNYRIDKANGKLIYTINSARATSSTGKLPVQPKVKDKEYSVVYSLVEMGGVFNLFIAGYSFKPA